MYSSMDIIHTVTQKIFLMQRFLVIDYIESCIFGQYFPILSELIELLKISDPKLAGSSIQVGLTYAKKHRK